MKKNKEILFELQRKIRNNDPDVLALILNYKDVQFSEDEIITFLEKMSSKKKYNEYYTISGSGGSRIIKPNITSIAFLYIASLGIPIVKTGSEAVTGIFGSTDFFRSMDLCNVEINNEKYHFAYYDGYSVSQWKKHKNLLSVNKAFKDYFQLNYFNDFKVKSKMSIQLDKQSAQDYLKKKIQRKSGKLFVVCNDNKDLIIDEVIGGKTIINDKIEYEFKNTGKYKRILNVSDVEKINNDLVFGNKSVDLFWYNTLKFEVSLFLYINRLVPSIFKGQEVFENAFKDKKVKLMLEECTNVLGTGGDINEVE